MAFGEIAEYLRRLRAGESVTNLQPTLGLIVEKEKIAGNGDYNFSGERYRMGIVRASQYPLVPIGEVCELIGGATPSKQNESYWQNGSVKWISSKHIDERGHIIGYELISNKAVEESSTKVAPKNSTIIITRVSVGKFAFADDDYAVNQDLTALVSKDTKHLTPEFIRVVAPHIAAVVEHNSEGIGVRGVTRSFLSKLEIPLPPLDIQKKIVTEIEGYQKVINGARAIFDNYHPHIPINPDWPSEELGDICEFRRGPFGGSLKKEIFVKSGYAVYEQSHAIANDFSEFRYFINQEKFDEMRGFKVCPGELIMSCSGTMGKVAIIPDNAPAGVINQALLKLTPTDRVLGIFLKLWIESENFQKSLSDLTYGAAIKNVASVGILKELRLPLPSLVTQQAIVAEIESEQALVAGNRELIERFEKKIQATLAQVWGEEITTPLEE